MHSRVRPNSTTERLIYEIRRDSLRRLVTCTFLFPFGTSQGSEDNSIPHHINRTREFSHYYSFINLVQRKPLNRMPRAKSQEPRANFPLRNEILPGRRGGAEKPTFSREATICMPRWRIPAWVPLPARVENTNSSTAPQL